MDCQNSIFSEIRLGVARFDSLFIKVVDISRHIYVNEKIE